ncbi:Aldo/keto reductase [Gymnopus androsaceus JB14]|uniref:Aldo/keto reductase n=1 Tax=Gymnopus androsaceus JB14 TaxID=1447944 RepID=A0A6A4H2Z0_9AGAR|nr:Aldo/keto reductase [Gymnopus androsaceus JB14]
MASHSHPAQKSELNVVMGAMTFGKEGTMGARVHDLKDVDAILDVFVAHGHTEIDTSRTYSGGTSEEMIGKVDWKSKGLKLETKLIALHIDSKTTPPQVQEYARHLSTENIEHTYEDMKKHILRSLKALNTDQLEMWYLHTPDRTIPYDVTMKAVNDLYKEGYFKKFAISNYMAWEVAEIVGICKANQYIMPSVYQGIYNAIHRSAEAELFLCLRKYGIAFYGFNPLAGGFFTGRYASLEDKPEPGSRFDPDIVARQGRPYADAHNLTMAEIALRWVSHHDAVLIGASSVAHIEQNLVDLEKGPLPEEVVKALDDAWESVKPFAAKYHH